MIKTFQGFVNMQPNPATQGSIFAKQIVAPGRAMQWDIIRIWAYSLGYETGSDAVSASSASNDPYRQQLRVGFAGAATRMQGLQLYGGLYRDAVTQDKLLQPFYYVPRSFEPIAPQQPIRVLEGQIVTFFVYEFQATQPALRPGRGVAWGIDYNEQQMGSNPA